MSILRTTARSRLARALRRRAARAREAAAPARVRYLGCPDGNVLQAIVETRAPEASVELHVGHPSLRSVTAVERHGSVHRFHVPLTSVLTDSTWAELPVTVTAQGHTLSVPSPAPSAAIDGHAFAGVPSATVKIAAGKARITRAESRRGLVLREATSTSTGLRLRLSSSVTRVDVESVDGTLTMSHAADDGVALIDLQALPARGETGPRYWRAFAVSPEGRLPLIAPEADLENVQLAYNFPMLIVRDLSDDQLYYAKPYFANADKSLRVRTGIRVENAENQKKASQ